MSNGPLKDSQENWQQDNEEVAASARSLAGELSSDPDRRFGESELFKFASRVGAGELLIQGDKVLCFLLLYVAFLLAGWMNSRSFD